MTEPPLLRRVGSKLSALLTTEGAVPRRTTAKPRETAAAPAAPIDHEEFEEHLRGLLREEKHPPAGRVNVIGLSKIREKLGDRWESVAERADEITRRAIENRLTKADVYTRYKDHHYLIIFAQLSKEQAQLKCALIAEEITKRLIGEDIAGDMLEVKTVVSQVGQDLAFEDVPSIEELAGQLGDGETVEVAPVVEEEEDWEKDTPETDPLDGIQIVYRPMWNVKQNLMTTYVAVPSLAGQNGRLLLGESELPRLSEPATVYRLDTMAQRRVITDLRQLVAARTPLLLCLPVHFETLAAKAHRDVYVERCRRGVPRDGTRYLVVEVIGIPEGIPQGRLLDLATTLRPFSRGILLRTTLKQNIFWSSSDTNIAAVGFEYSAGRVPESQCMQDMVRFAAAAKRVGLTAYVHGLRTLSLTTAAISAGFDFVDGDVVSSVTERPQPVTSFELRDLYRSQMPPSP